MSKFKNNHYIGLQHSCIPKGWPRLYLPFSNFIYNFLLISDGNNSLISENAADHKFDEFVSLMQDIPANEEFPEESNAVQEEVPDTYIYAEELASLIEEIEVEKVASGVEETKDESIEHELLYQDSRITVGESLALTMAFIMRQKLSMVATNDLIILLELHCPKENNAVKGLSQFKDHIQYLKHPMKKHFCCPNPKCQVYISVGKPKDGEVCRICSGLLSDKSFFIELPIEDQLHTILSRKLYNILYILLYTSVVCSTLRTQGFLKSLN